MFKSLQHGRRPSACPGCLPIWWEACCPGCCRGCSGTRFREVVAIVGFIPVIAAMEATSGCSPPRSSFEGLRPASWSLTDVWKIFFREAKIAF